MKKALRVGCLSLFGLALLLAIGAKIYTYSQSEAVYDAVVRYHTQNDPDHHHIYFLSINRHDPSASLLKRLENCGYTIRKRSDAKADPGALSSLEVMDKTTGEKGELLSLFRIFWYSPSHLFVVTADGGYEAEKRGKKWYVVNRMIMGG